MALMAHEEHHDAGPDTHLAIVPVSHQDVADDPLGDRARRLARRKPCCQPGDPQVQDS